MNSTTGKSDTTSTTQYISHLLYIVDVVEGAWMVIGNGLIIVTLLFHKTMQKNRMATAVALAIGDGLYGVGIFTGGIRRLHLVVTHTDGVLMSGWQCLLQFPTIFYIAGAQMTALAMVLISVDRYIAAAHSSYYLGLNAKRHARHMILSVVAFGGATSALAVVSCYFGWGDDSTHVVKWPAICVGTWALPAWYATGCTMFILVAGYVSIFVYVLVLRAYRKYVRSGNNNGRSNVMSIKMQREREITITMAFVTLMTLLFHSIPYTIVVATTMLKLQSAFVSLLIPFLFCLVCGNSLVNIFVYLKRHADIRSAMSDVLRGRFKPIVVQPVSFQLQQARVVRSSPF